MVHKMKKEELLKNAHEIATKEVNVKREKMLHDNQHMIKNLGEISKEYEKLKQENQIDSEENVNTKIFLSLKEDEINEYQEIISGEKNINLKLKQKVSNLKNFLSEEVSKFTKEKELEEFNNDEIMKECATQKEILRAAVEKKNQDLKVIRGLSKAIIQQKNDVETFFITTVSNLTEEIKESKAHREGLIHDGSNEKEEGTKVRSTLENTEISELDLEQKEKILRVLYSKVYNGKRVEEW